MTEYDQVIAAIDRMFADTSKPVADAREELRDVIAHCRTLLDALPDDDD